MNIKIKDKCSLCGGSKITEYFDMNDMPNIPPGKYTLGELCEKYGHTSPCPECCNEDYILENSKHLLN